MRSGKFHLSRVAGLLLSGATCICAENFAPPAEGPVAFRRDRVPLDAEAMAGLSRQLVTLAQGLNFKTAANRRAVAQALALSAGLDPANSRARELIEEFQKAPPPTAADPEEVARCRERIRQYLTWLETPEAGSHGQALAACLTDIMRISGPENPQPEALSVAGERGAWKGWVPELAAYEPVAAPVEPAPPKESPIPEAGILLSNAQVFTPLWQKTSEAESAKWILCPAPLQMSAEMIRAETGDDPPFSIIIGSTEHDHRFDQLSVRLLKILKKQHETLPAGGRVTIESDGLESSLLSKKRLTISAAAAVLASSAISNREPDATIIGLIDESGAFTLPAGFWEQLQSLSPGKGGRLVLPAAAAAYLPSMLALEKPGFFFEYEILLAANFTELLDLTEKIPHGTLEKATTQFREIRAKAASQPVGQYLANTFVRRRLAEITQDAAYHYSAKMLALQGAGNRPAFVRLEVLAFELHRAIEPITQIMNQVEPKFEILQSNQLGSIHEACRNEVSRLFRYAEKGDRELLVRVQDMIDTLRPLERALKTRDEFKSSSPESFSAYSALTRAHAEVIAELATIIGDPEAAAELK
jgi:hypothetical protein